MNTLVTLGWPTVSPRIASGSPTVLGERIVAPLHTESHTERLAQLLYEIQQIYKITQPRVQLFLRKHPLLLEVVYEAAEHLRKIFGPEAQLELRLLQDPESGDEELFALIHVHSDVPPDHALNQLQQFDEEWFLSVQDEIDGLFNVDVVFE